MLVNIRIMPAVHGRTHQTVMAEPEVGWDKAAFETQERSCWEGVFTVTEHTDPEFVTVIENGPCETAYRRLIYIYWLLNMEHEQYYYVLWQDGPTYHVTAIHDCEDEIEFRLVPIAAST